MANNDKTLKSTKKSAKKINQVNYPSSIRRKGNCNEFLSPYCIKNNSIKRLSMSRVHQNLKKINPNTFRIYLGT